MRTRTSIFDVFYGEGIEEGIKVRAGKKDGEIVESVISPARALAVYQVLTGRRDGTGWNTVLRDKGEKLSFRIYKFIRKNENGEADDGGEVEEGKRIVVFRNDDRILSLLLRVGGSLALAEEVKEAIRKALANGKYIEVGSEDLYCFVDSRKIRLAYKAPPIVLSRKHIQVLKSAIEKGIALDGPIGWDGKFLTIQGRQVQGKSEGILLSVIEVVA